MIVLNHTGTTLAQFIHFPFNTTGQDTDQSADDKHAAQSNQEHHPPETPSCIAAHCAGIQSTHEAEPDSLEKCQGIACITWPDAQQNERQSRQQDNHQRQEAQTAHQGDGSPRHKIVKAIAQFVSPLDFAHSYLIHYLKN